MRVGWKRYINFNLDVNKISLYIGQFAHCTDCLCRVFFFSRIYQFYSDVLCQKQVSRAGTRNCIKQYIWDAITCPCREVLCEKQISKAGTVNYIPQYRWDVLTFLWKADSGKNNPELLIVWSWDNLDNFMFRLRVSKYLRCCSLNV